MTIDSKTLEKIVKRRHPKYVAMLEHWNFLSNTYSGGREWFEGNIFTHIKEGDTEFTERKKRSYRFNHTKEVVDLVNKYLFKKKPDRNNDDANKVIKDYWKEATRSGMDIDQFISVVSTKSSIFGKVWVFTDTNASEETISKADEKELGSKTYSYIIEPQDVLDVGYSDGGDLIWILIREYIRDDDDPISSTGEITEQFRLWTKDEWLVIRIEDKKDNKTAKYVLHSRGINSLKRVPAICVDHTIVDDRYNTPALINDIAYLDRAVANYLSNLDAIIQDQTFSQLAMPAQNLMPGDEGYLKVLEMGTKRVFLYDGEGGKGPEYISPDIKQASIIMEVVTKIVGEIYHSVGMAGERTKQDNAAGIDNSSGVAKAYDFERVNSLLASKANSLENFENKLINMVLAWNSEKPLETELVKYPETFDVRSLYDEFTIAEKLALVDAPKEIRREQMKQVIDKLFPKLATDLKEKLSDELKDWLEGEETLLPNLKQPSVKSVKNPATSKRQGQITADTE